MADTIERRTLSLRGAQRILEAAIAEAARAGLHVSVAVLGSNGQLKAFAAMDGASILSTETARKKALTVIKVGKGTQEFASDLKKEMAEEPELFHGMLAMDGITAIGGGVPIQVGGANGGAGAGSGGPGAAGQRNPPKGGAGVG